MTNETDVPRVLPFETDQLSRDAHFAQVATILRGATRGARDPDVELTILLANLYPATDNTLRSALATLLKNANSD